jgi:hypothetical protein
MGEKVLNEIVERIKRSKYYSISVDSTPDEAHIDQLTVVIRYMEGSAPKERLLTSFQIVVIAVLPKQKLC